MSSLLKQLVTQEKSRELAVEQKQPTFEQAKSRRPETIKELSLLDKIYGIGERAPKNLLDMALFGVKFGGGAVQETLRSYIKAGLSLGRKAEELAYGRPVTEQVPTIKPKGIAQKVAFGEEPIVPAEEFGRELLGGLGISQQKAKKYGPGIGVFLTTLDLVPFLPGSKKVPTSIANALVKKYGEKTATEILIRGNKKIARQALEKGGEVVVQKLGIPIKEVNLGDDYFNRLISEGKVLEGISLPSQRTSATRYVDLKARDSLSKISATRSPFSSDTLKIDPRKSKYFGQVMSDIKLKTSLQSLYQTVPKKARWLIRELEKVGERARVDIDIKTPEGVLSKIIRRRDEGRIKYGLNDVHDLVRSRVVFNTEKEMRVAVKKMEERLVEIEDFFKKPNGWGYRAIHGKIKLPDGSFAEIQFHTRKSLEVAKAIRPLFSSYRGAAGRIPKYIYEQSRELAKEVMTGKNIESIQKINEQARVIEAKVVSQKFREDKLDLSTETIAEIKRRLATLGLTKRKVKTFGDIETAAKELGVDIRTLLRDVNTRRITGEEVVALRNVIRDHVNFIRKAEQKIRNRPSLEKELRPQISASSRELDVALTKVVRGGTEAGRTVAAFRIMAGQSLDPAFWFIKAKQMLGAREFTRETEQTILTLIADGDRIGLANFVAMLRKPSIAEKAITLWKAGLLTAFTTHLANVGGGVTMASLMTASDVIGTGLDVMAALFTGKRMVTISPATIAAKARGIVRGVKDAGRYLKTGAYPEDIMIKWDIRHAVHFKNKILDGYTQAIFRSLGAEDIIFRKAAWSEAMQKQAIVIAKNERLRGVALKARVKELLITPTNEMAANAIDAAEYATFTNPNALAAFISGGKRSTSETVRTATEFVSPFVSTPTNIAARIADFSPAGFVKAMVGVARPTTRSQKRFIEDLSRAITGTGIIALGAYLGRKGLMTGNAPEGPAERAQFYAEGKQSNSLLLEGVWYQLNRVSPFGNLLALGAEFERLSREKEGLSLGAATLGAGTKGLTEQTFLTGLSGALKAISEPERGAEKYVERGVASVVPTIIGHIAQTTDTTLRVPENVLEAVATRLPGFSENVAARRDIFGEPAERGGGKLRLVDPFSRKKAVYDPVIEEAKSLKITIGLPSQTIDGIRLTNKEYSFYLAVRGGVTKKALLTLIESPEYNALGLTERAKLFDRVRRDVAESVNNSIFAAIVINRFKLPNVSPVVLRDVLKELTKRDEFNKMNDNKKALIISNLLKKVVATR